MMIQSKPGSREFSDSSPMLSRYPVGMDVTTRMLDGSTRRRSSTAASRAALARGVLTAFLLLALAASLAAAGCSSDNLSVNGQTIDRAQFNAEVARRLAVVKKTNPEELEGSRGRKLVGTTRREVATDMVRDVLMDQQAKKLGITLAPDAVKQTIEVERRKAGADNLAKSLKEQGITEAAYEKKVRAELIVDAIGRQVCAGVTTTKDEAESYYLTNKDAFTRSLMIHAAHILLETKGEADTVANELRAGKDFAQIASVASKDNATRSNGGDLGWIEQGSMDPAFESAAFGLKSGQMSVPVAASDGYHIIKVLERREASTPPFSEVWQEAMNKLETRKKEEAFGDWLRTVYANARIETGGLGTWDARLGVVRER